MENSLAMKRLIAILCLAACMPMVWAATPKKESKSTKNPDYQEQVIETEEPVAHEPLVNRYYRRSGKTYLSLISVGYSTFFMLPNNPQGYAPTEFAGKRHLLNFDVFNWRAGFFGMSLFNLEMGLNNTCVTASGDSLTTLMGGGPNNDLIPAKMATMWFAYKPTFNFYIPITDWLAATLYFGMDVDLCKLMYVIRKNYYVDAATPENNFHLGLIGGAGFRFSPHGQLPIDIRCEYRHPVMGNKGIIPQGIYLTAQVGFGWVLKRQ